MILPITNKALIDYYDELNEQNAGYPYVSEYNNIDKIRNIEYGLMLIFGICLCTCGIFATLSFIIGWMIHKYKTNKN